MIVSRVTTEDFPFIERIRLVVFVIGFSVFQDMVGQPLVSLNALDVWAVCHGRTLTVLSQPCRREGGASMGCSDELDIGDGLLLNLASSF